MLIHTINFGDLEVPEDKVINFKEGLPGFPQLRRFVVLEFENLKPFRYLQGLGDPPIALLIINPFLVDREYKFQLSASEMEEIGTTQPEEIAVYVVATIPENPEQATINLMAPIVVNDRKRSGKQVMLQESVYSIRHPLLKASKTGAGGVNC